MIYELSLSPGFVADAEEQLSYLIDQGVSVDRAVAWYHRLLNRFDGIREWAKVHPIDERFLQETGIAARKINFGDYVILYRVDEDRRLVEIIALQHGATRE